MEEYFDVLDEKGNFTNTVETRKNAMLRDYGIRQ